VAERDRNLEGAADFMQMQEELFRAGYAWVGVGAQAAGVNSPRSGLKTGTRCAMDPWSIQATPTRTTSSRSLPTRCGVPRRSIRWAPDGSDDARDRAIESAFRLVTYINAVHPITHPFDGYLVHSRGANASGFRAEGLARDTENPVPAGAHLRTDVDVPVLDVQTEGDMSPCAPISRTSSRSHTTAGGRSPAPRMPKRRAGSPKPRRRSTWVRAARIR